ncbi:MAG TPA: hypothetical protein VK447_11575 [Myxococcaceae bacterium]|nr:hypothetical protein [Myxococcaceae bacterium]
MEERPSYLKAAFLNVYNLGLVGGAVAASAMTGEYVVTALALGAEALWLLFGPDLRPFRRAVDQAHREEREQADRAKVKKMMESLPEREWARARALDELRREIERDMQQNPTFQAILMQSEVEKLSHLLKSFVSLATACVRAETYLSATDPRDLNKQIDVQKNLVKSLKDPAAQQIASKNIQVLEKRLETMKEIQNFLARARGQMNLIENTVRLLRDQVLTMASPDQLGEQLDDLLTGVDAIQDSAREHEAIFSKINLEPITPLEGESAEPNRGGRVRG